MAATRNVALEKVEGFGNHIKSTIATFSDEQFTTWNQKQCYTVRT